MTKKLEAVIGLEIHLQLKTKTKMFCSCANVSGDAEPNTAVCPVCMGHPGTLPTINREAVRLALKLAIALGSSVAVTMRFDRKNYFYPDLPKGYQISQFDHPLASGGGLTFRVRGEERRIALERLHLEEDAGKNFHKNNETLVDFNRAGTPLVEIVTKPELRSAEEARAFLQELRLLARYVGASDADMEKGQMRCDANISMRPSGEKTLYAKTELKNLNSFKFVEQALTHEIERQSELWKEGNPPQKNETRGWDDTAQRSVPQRTKEGSDDYRYFPEPDLPPVRISEADVESTERELPELPGAKRDRFVSEYELKISDADVLIADRKNADFFEAVMSELKSWLLETVPEDGTHEEIWTKNRRKLTRLAFSWITTELFKHLNADKKGIDEVSLTPENMAEFIILVYEAKVNSSAAQIILDRMYHEGKDPSDIALDGDLLQSSDEDELTGWVTRVIAENPEQAEAFRNGKEPVLQFLVGKVMKVSGGKVNPGRASAVLRERLNR